MNTMKLLLLFIGIGLLVAVAALKDFFFSFGKTKSDLDEINGGDDADYWSRRP